MNKYLLSARNLSVDRYQKGQNHSVLGDINFDISGGKVYTILGNNGSGKSTLLKSLTGLLSEEDFITSGQVFFNGQLLSDCSWEKLRTFRQKNIKYVFQDSQTSFNPLKKMQYYFDKIYNIKTGVDDMLDYFLLPPKEKLFKMYPHELSGGMAQRVLIVLSFLTNPDIIFFDEPTSALDTPVSNLLCLKIKEFVQNEESKAALVVTQDTVFAKNVSDEIAVLSDGKLSPFQKAKQFFENIKSL